MPFNPPPRPDIYVLDDVLSALDSKVGSYIMEETILGVLKGKTIILVTHGLQYLKYSDKIYVMDKGKIMIDGQFDDIQESELYLKFLELDEVRLLSLTVISGAKI